MNWSRNSLPLWVLESAAAEAWKQTQAKLIRPKAAAPARKFAFRGGALRLQACDDPEVILSGPAETGKTIATLYRLHALAMRYPVRAAIVRKVRADMDSTVLQTWQQKILDPADGVSVFGGSKPEWFDYASGARVYVAGMDRPGKVLSGELDVVYVNQAEELHLADWETITTRATGRAGNMPFAQVLGDCNPGPANHWIRQRVGLTFLESRHEDNPRLFLDDGTVTAEGARTLATLDRLTGVRKARLRHGRWVSAEGTVYEFDANIHILDRVTIGDDWRRIRVIDFGFTNPFVCQWWAIDPDGRMYLYRELYRTQRTVRAHAEQIKAVSQGERYEATVADHDAEDRATLAECGISTIPAVKDVSVGIQKTQERLAPAGDGRPRLFVVRGALIERDEALDAERKPLCTEQEFDVYVWPKAADGKPSKEAPVKLNDHGMDAMRYGVMYLDRPPVRTVPNPFYD